MTLNFIKPPVLVPPPPKKPQRMRFMAHYVPPQKVLGGIESNAGEQVISAT